MTNPNKPYQSGHWRAYIDTDPMGRKSTLFVMKDDNVAMIYEKGLSLVRMDEAVKLNDDKALMEWDDFFEDDIIDMWKAVGKALDVYNDQPGRAYAQGLSEGRAEVLREWNDELRGILKDVGQALLKDEYRDEALD